MLVFPCVDFQNAFTEVRRYKGRSKLTGRVENYLLVCLCARETVLLCIPFIYIASRK